MAEQEMASKPIDQTHISRDRLSFWHLHRSTKLIAFLALLILVLLMVPGQRSRYWGKDKRWFSSVNQLEETKYRFHGWPAIHCVTFENYELYHSNLNKRGRFLQNTTMKIAGINKTIPEGSKENQELALKLSKEAAEYYEPNSWFWAYPPNFDFDGDDGFALGMPGSRNPNWMDLSNWTMGMNRTMQWQGLAINLSVAIGIILAVSTVFEFRRRRRQSFWQISLFEFGVFVTVFSVGSWYFSGRYKTVHTIMNLQSKGIVTQTASEADPSWLAKLIGPWCCTRFTNLNLDMSKVGEADHIQLKRLRDIRPWYYHLESFSHKDAMAVGLVPNANSLTLTLAKDPGEIDWKEVPFGEEIDFLSIRSFDSDDKMLAKTMKRNQSKYSTTLKSLGSIGGRPLKQTYTYPLISFDLIDSATKAAKNLESISIDGFLIDSPFIQRLDKHQQITSVSFSHCRITDTAYTELMKMRPLEKLYADRTENLTEEQLQHLYTRHGDPKAATR